MKPAPSIADLSNRRVLRGKLCKLSVVIIVPSSEVFAFDFFSKILSVDLSEVLMTMILQEVMSDL